MVTSKVIDDDTLAFPPPPYYLKIGAFLIFDHASGMVTLKQALVGFNYASHAHHL